MSTPFYSKSSSRTAEQLAETERRAGDSIQEFYASSRRRTVAPLFVGD